MRLRDLFSESTTVLDESAAWTKYIRVAKNDAVLTIEPKNLLLHTSGKGLWSIRADAVPIAEITQYVDFEYGGTELKVVFDPDDWDVSKAGLIYTDPLFERELRAYMKTLGFPAKIVDDIGYSEQGMQEEDYVSFDAYDLGNLILEYALLGDLSTINSRKQQILGRLIQHANDGQKSIVQAILDGLDNHNVNWPELAAIRKRLGSDD